MDNTNLTQYTFSHRLKGEVTLSLFDKYYLEVREKKLNKERQFKLEVAMLNPKPTHVYDLAFHWLAAAIIVALADIAFIYYLLNAAASDDLWTTVLAIAVTTLLAAGFVGLFLFSSERKWVLETRASLYPLVEIPYTSKNKERARLFLEQLQATIARNIEARGYTPDTLFAGEMRMLRRLAKHNILSIKTYDKAKKHMLAAHGQSHAA